MVSKGKKTVIVEVAGIRKKITLNSVKEKTPFGEFTLLDSREHGEVPKVEFLRLADELNKAILSPYGKIFPTGKTARDMIALESKPKKKTKKTR